jgi:hypothetical protein
MKSSLPLPLPQDIGPLNTIVHVGAGADAREEDYSPLQANRIVLIEADPEAASRLAERFEGHPSITVLHHLIAAREEDTVFYRFTLPAFNAPLGLGRLREIYPRVAQEGTLFMRSRTLPSILEQHGVRSGERNLLILEIPGQERSVLASLSPENWDAVPFVLLHSCSEAWQEGADAITASLDLLRTSLFQPAQLDQGDPAWPSAFLIRDSAKADMRKKLEAQALELAAQSLRIQEKETHVSTLEAERNTLADEHAALESRLKALIAENDELTNRNQELAAQSLRIQEQETHVSTLEAERNTLADEHAALDSKLTALIAENADLANRNQQLEAERESLVSERDQAIAQRDEKQSVLNSLYRTLGQVDQARQTTLMDKLTEIAKDRDQLLQKVGRLERELNDSEDKRIFLDRVVMKTDAQLQFIKELFLRGSLR